ncbi:unnamed protein product [Arabidopsis halleri]
MISSRTLVPVDLLLLPWPFLLLHLHLEVPLKLPQQLKRKIRY